MLKSSHTRVYRSAKAYSQALFTGVDLVPIDSTLSYPNNANFVIQDINLGLDQYRDECHILQAAFISRGVRTFWLYLDEVYYRLTQRNLQVLSFHSLLTSITEALRAGGLLLLIDFDPVSYTAPGVAYTPPVSSGGTSVSLPAAVRLLKAVNYACTSRGADILSVQHFKAYNNINFPV